MNAVWRPKDLAGINKVPFPLRAWLLEQGSLVRQLRRTCKNQFNLQLKSQRWEYPVTSESKLLKLRTNEKTLIREVLLKDDNTPLVYARTVIPRRSLKGKNRMLNRLNTRPIGTILFNRTDIPRKKLEYAKISPVENLYPNIPEAVGDEEFLWGRRSVFNLNKKPLLITEVFFPSVITSRCR